MFVIEILVEANAPPEGVSRAWEAVVERIVGGDPSLDTSLAPRMHRFARCIGWLLTKLDAPMAKLQKAYVALEPRRRRCRHGTVYEMYPGNEGSLVLLRGALSLLEYLKSSRTLGEEDLARFEWVVAAAQRLRFTAALDVNHLTEDLVLSCFCYATLFAPPERDVLINDMLPSVASRPDLAIRALGGLATNGVPLNDVERLATSAGLKVQELKTQAEALLGCGVIQETDAPLLDQCLAKLGSPNRLKWK